VCWGLLWGPPLGVFGSAPFRGLYYPPEFLTGESESPGVAPGGGWGVGVGVGGYLLRILSFLREEFWKDLRVVGGGVVGGGVGGRPLGGIPPG